MDSALDDPPANACSPSTHPLELIPFFRRYPRGIARDLVYTAIWNTLIAVIFALVAVVIDPRTPFLAQLG